MKKEINKKINTIVIIGVAMMMLFFANNATLAAEGDTWITPINESLSANQNFDVRVYVDTGIKKLNVFSMYLDFDPTYITVDISQGENPGANDGKGFHKGANTQNYTMGSNSGDIANGHFRFAGMAGISGTVGSNQHIITIHLKTTAAFTSGTTSLALRVDEMAEAQEDDILVGVRNGSTIAYQAGTAPTVTEVTAVPTPSDDTTPSYTFNYSNNTGLGTADWGGSCDGYFPETANGVGAGNNNATATVMPDGDYNDCTLTVTDAGTSASTTIFVTPFTVDTTGPSLAVVTPVASPTNDTTPDYTFSSDEAGTITYAGDCSSADTSAIAGNNTITFNALAAGTHSNCTIRVQDASGNNSSVLNVNSFTVDTTAPTLAEVTAVTTPTNDSTPDYTFSSNEAGTITYAGDCSSADTSAIAGNNTITFNALAAGTHSNCTIVITDEAGNASVALNVTSFEVTTPVIAEVTTVTTPSNDVTPTYVYSAGNLNGGTATADWGGACNGYFSEAVNAVVTGNNSATATSNMPSGTYANCTLTVNDGVIDSNTINIPSFTIDTTGPSLAVVIPVASPTNDTTPDYTFSSDEAGTITYAGDCSSADTSAIAGNNTITFNALAAGTHSNCTIRVQDASGNNSSVLNVNSFTVDTTAPTLAEVTAVTTPTNDSTPDYTFSSNEAGTITYAGDCSSADTSAIAGNNTITFNALAAGTHSNCTIVVTDEAGNASVALNVTSFEVTAPPTCTSFTYSSWGACQSNNKQNRTIVSSLPGGCVGGVPIVEQGCSYMSGGGVGDKNVNDFTLKVKIKHSHKKYKLDRKKTLYLKKKKLSFRGEATELIGGKVQLFIDGKLEKEVVVGADGKWELGKKMKKNSRHKLRFKYFSSDGSYLGESHKYKIKIDTRKPRFINLPAFLVKRVGDRVHFRATDSKKSKKVYRKVKYYKYYFLGKKHKTKKPEFIIPAGTTKGLHTLKIRAYDKAGNKVTKIVIIRVR